MLDLCSSQSPLSPFVHRINGPGSFSRARADDAPLLLWSLGVDTDIAVWLCAVDPATFPNIREIVATGAVEATVARALAPLSGASAALAQDVAAHATHFAQAMGVDFVRVRLSAVTHDSCAKFHVDGVTARLILTYHGPGTELGVASAGHQPAEIFHTAPGDVLFLRGRDWPGAELDPERETLVHRSPPMAGSGAFRIVLVIDPITDPTVEA